MKTRLSFLMVLALLAILVGASVGAAQAEETIAIGPDSLAIAEYETPYSQQLTASGGTGPYTFSVSGALPYGVALSPDGLLLGFPDGFDYNGTVPGPYPITIQVQDAAGDTASRDYTLVLDKGTPTIGAYAGDIYWMSPFNLWADVTMETPYGYTNILDGTVAFSIDGTLVPGCEAVTGELSYYPCLEATMDLSVGTHTLEAVYTPTGWYASYFYPATASSQFTVQPRSFTIQGALFRDDNQNGGKDGGEYNVSEGGWTVNLDQDCDGDVDYATTPYYGGFAFNSVPSSGQCNRITVVGAPGYQQTTQLADFILSEHAWITIGFYYPRITLSPSEYELPSGTVGEEYDQQVFTASGGTGPYVYTIRESEWEDPLPAGLTLSADGILSGTPTAAGSYYLTVQAEDAKGAVGRGFYYLTIEAIKVDGVFTFTSSASPSAPGEAVTFTVSATGDAVHSHYGPVPPVGYVTFSADGAPIEGCSNAYLNLVINESGMTIGNYPATCTTAALGTGTHEITVAYTDGMGLYNTPSLALTQVVKQSDTTPPVVTVTGVTEGAAYPRGSVPTAGCSTTDAQSGVATQAILSLTGGDAQGLGSFAATCSGAVDNATNVAAPVSVHYAVVASADLSISKTDSKDPVKPGAKLVYTLAVRNAGPDAALSLTLQDTLDNNTTFSSVSAPKGWRCSYANGKVTCTSASLASGSSAVIKITVTVNKGAKVGKDLVNNASVSSATSDPNLLNNSVVQKTLVSK